MASSKDKSQAANEIAGSKRLLEAVFKGKTPPFRPKTGTMSFKQKTDGTLHPIPESADPLRKEMAEAFNRGAQGGSLYPSATSSTGVPLGQTASDDLPEWKPEYLDTKLMSATEAVNMLTHEPRSTDIWSVAKALDVLREESYSFGGAPVICQVLEDAARYLGEFGGIRSKAEMDERVAHHGRFAEAVEQRVYETDAYREGERILRLREARKLRAATRKTKKVVKRG